MQADIGVTDAKRLGILDRAALAGPSLKANQYVRAQGRALSTRLFFERASGRKGT